MSHTGFSPGDSGGSQNAPTSSGSYTLPEPQNKVRREVERLERRVVPHAAPAVLPITWQEDRGVAAILDDEGSLKSRRSATSMSSSSAEQQLHLAKKKRELIEAEIKEIEAQQALVLASSRSRGSRTSRARGAHGASSSTKYFHQVPPPSSSTK